MPASPADGRLVALPGDAVAYLASPQALAYRLVAVRLVRADARRGAPRPAGTDARNLNAVHHCLELCTVRALALCQDQREHAAPAVGAQVNPGCGAASRATRGIALTYRSCRFANTRPEPAGGVAPVRKGHRHSTVGTSGVLVGAHGCGVDRDLPVDVTFRIGFGLEPTQHQGPGTVRRPPPMPFGNGLPRPVAVRQVTPRHTGPNPVQHPVDHLPVVAPPAAPPGAHRQVRPKPLPLRIREIAPASVLHGRVNDRSANRKPGRRLRRAALKEGAQTDDASGDRRAWGCPGPGDGPLFVNGDLMRLSARCASAALMLIIPLAAARGGSRRPLRAGCRGSPAQDGQGRPR